jgi:hypothetical protein
MSQLTTEDAEILTRIEDFIADYASIPQPHFALPIALWVLGTYCFQKFDAFGYLTFTSASPGAGKTRMLEILDCLCKDAKLKAKITLAAMCSLIEQFEPTLLIDQAERLSKSEHNDFMACLLSGYRTGMPITIQYKGVAVDRPIYCPKAFALLGDMLDAARDRSIIVEMRPMRPRRRWYRPEAKERGESLRKICAEAVTHHSDDIDDAFANFAGLPFLLDREEEIWTPIFVLADVFCRHRRAELERAAADICATKRAEPKQVSTREGKQRADALRDGERLRHDLLALCGSEAGVRTGEVLGKLKEIHDAPWRNYAGQGLTAIKLAELLRPYGVAPRQFKMNGQNVRGYLRENLLESLRRTGPEAAVPVSAATDELTSDIEGE